MKIITVTLTLQVNDDAVIENVVNDIDINFYGDIDDIINISGQTEPEVSNEKDD